MTPCERHANSAEFGRLEKQMWPQYVPSIDLEDFTVTLRTRGMLKCQVKEGDDSLDSVYVEANMLIAVFFCTSWVGQKSLFLQDSIPGLKCHSWAVLSGLGKWLHWLRRPDIVWQIADPSVACHRCVSWNCIYQQRTVLGVARKVPGIGL